MAAASVQWPGPDLRCRTAGSRVSGPVSALPGFLWGVGTPSLSWEAVGTHGALTGRGCILA